MYILAGLLTLACLAMLGWKTAPRATDFMPSRDADLDLWAANFNALIVASPTTYGLDTAYATALTPLYTAFHDALALLSNPATFTPVNVANKDAEKAALKTFVRVGAAIVQAQPAISNEDKLSLGLPIHNNAPSPIPTPVTWPIIDQANQGPLTQVIFSADSLTPNSRRKPSGVIGMIMLLEASAAPITSTDEIRFAKLVSRTPDTWTFDSGDEGKKAYVAGRWVTRTGLMGPWSAIGNHTVA